MSREILNHLFLSYVSTSFFPFCELHMYTQQKHSKCTLILSWYPQDACLFNT